MSLYAAAALALLANGAVYGQAKYIEPRAVPADQQEPLAGTKKLALEGDIASQMIEGIDRFLLRKLDESVEKRERHWKRDFSSPEAYAKSIEPNRKRLAHILGARDATRRLPFPPPPEVVAYPDQPISVAEGESFQIHHVRWPGVRSHSASRWLPRNTWQKAAVGSSSLQSFPARSSGIRK
jgi:hypothetical protein